MCGKSYLASSVYEVYSRGSASSSRLVLSVYSPVLSLRFVETIQTLITGGAVHAKFRNESGGNRFLYGEASFMSTPLLSHP